MQNSEQRRHADTDPQGPVRGGSVPSSQVDTQQEDDPIRPVTPAPYHYSGGVSPQDASRGVPAFPVDKPLSVQLNSQALQPAVRTLSSGTFRRGKRWVGCLFGSVLVVASFCGFVEIFTWKKRVDRFSPRHEHMMIPDRLGEAAILDISVQIVYGAQSDEFFSTLYSGHDVLSLFIEQPYPEQTGGRRFTLSQQHYNALNNLLEVLQWMYEDSQNGQTNVRSIVAQYLQYHAASYNTHDAFTLEANAYLDAYDAYINKLRNLGPNQSKDDLLRFFAQERKRYYRQLLQSESLHDSERDEIRRLLRILDDLVGIYKSHNYFQTDGVSLRERINEETFFRKIFSQPPPPRV